MERTLFWIRENPQLAAVALSGAIVALVVTVLGFMMVKAGTSLRPIIWFAGFFAIVAGPQAAVHVLDGLVLSRDRADAKSAAGAAKVSTTVPRVLTPVSWGAVFGSKADPDLITDAKRGLAAILSEAEEAKLSFNTAGESALAARFASASKAANALNTYGTFFAFAQATASDDGGWTARRHGGQGEWVHVVKAGRELYAWTSATREAVLTRRVAALGPYIDTPSQDAHPDLAAAASRQVSNRLASYPTVALGIVALNLFAAVGWFFKGSAWAARVEAAPKALPASTEMLGRDLLAVNGQVQPTAVTRRDDGAFEVNWRYADAHWWDLMRVHKMKRTHRLVLFLDEATHTVRVREYWSAFDASAGPDRLRLAWTMNSGIQFFAVEHNRVFGVQIDSDGRPTGDLSQAFTFDLQALKAPVIAAITQAGWRWQPVTWNSPAALRWLTE